MFIHNQIRDYEVNSLETKDLEEKLNELFSLIISKNDYPKNNYFSKVEDKRKNYIIPCMYRKKSPCQ